MYLDFSLKLVHKKYILIFLSFILIFIINSCEFSPTGVNYVDIKQTTPIAHINLNNSNDTLKVFGQTYFDYNIDIGNRNADSVNLYIDGKLFSYSMSLKQSVFFNSLSYSNSYHSLKIEVKSNSGTGSIADVFGVEKVLFSKKFVLVIDNSTSPVSIISAYPSDGRLKIEWKRYSSFNFQSYQVYADNILFATIKNQSTTYWIDSNYVCGNVSFRIDVGAANMTGKGNTFNYSGNFSNIISLLVTDSNKVKITWSKNIFYNNFGEYAIYRGDEYNEKLIDKLNNINDTTYIDKNPYFGNEIFYKIDAYPPNYYGTINDSKRMSCFLGKKMMPANSIYYVPSLNSIYIFNYNGIYRLNANNYTVLDSISSQNLNTDPSASSLLSISENGQYAYLTYGASFLKINPLTLSIEKTIPTNTIVGYNSYAGSSFQVNDSNFIAYSSCTKILFYEGIQLVNNLILNMNNSTIADSLPHSESNFGCKISQNNKYFYADNNLYSINNNQLNKIGSVNSSEFSFIGNGDKYIALNNSAIQIRNSSNMSLITSINSNGAADFSFDPATGWIGGTAIINGDYYYIIYDSNNGREITRIHVYPSYNYHMANSALFSPNGFYLPLK